MSTLQGSDEPSERAPLLARQRTVSSIARSVEEEETPRIALPRAVSICISFGLLVFIQSANFSIMTTTYSEVAEELKAYDETSWFTSAYLISMGSLSPFYGRLTQIFDPRNCALGASIIFALGSIITSLAHTFWMFIMGRAISGIGGAGIYTLTVNLVIYLADKKRQGFFIGAAGACITAGVSLGAVIGGALVGPLGWRPLFWLQAPITLLAAICLFLSIPKKSKMHPSQAQPLKDKLASIDYVGSLLLVASLTSLLIGLSAPVIHWAPMLAAGVLLVLFVLQELYRAPSPAVPIAVLASRGALFSCATQLTFMIARWCVLFYSPIYTLVVRSWAPARAGTILIPTNLGFALGAMGVGWVHIRRSGSYYTATLVCQTAFPLTILLLTQCMTPTSSVPLVMSLVLVNGLLAGAAVNYGLAHVMHVTPPATHFVATALLVTARGFAGSFGSGIGGGVFGRTLRAELEGEFARRNISHAHHLIDQLIGRPALVPHLPAPQRELATHAYAQALRTLFWASAGLAALAIFTQAATGWSSWDERQNNNGKDGWTQWKSRAKEIFGGGGGGGVKQGGEEGLQGDRAARSSAEEENNT